MYKKRYFLAFYDADGERFKYLFDSIFDIVNYLKIDYSDKKKVNKIYSDIYYGLKYEKPIKILGEPMRVYLIDIN